MEIAQPELTHAISPKEASAIADEVRELMKAGDQDSALARLTWLHPADIGAILVALPKASRDTLLALMGPEAVTWMLRQMNPLLAGRIVTRLGSRLVSGVLTQVNPMVALETLLRLPKPQARQVAKTLEQPIPDTQILEGPSGTAGALMVPECPTVRAGATISDARAGLREMGEPLYEFNRVYVVGDEGQLMGQVTMADLAKLPEESRISDATLPVPVTVSEDTPQSECVRLRSHYNAVQLPVVSDEKLIGVVPLDLLETAVVEEHTKQMLKMGAVLAEPGPESIADAVRTRLPWLAINLVTTFLSAATISLFDSVLAQAVILAAFLPVIAGQGGIGGTQTLTMIVRSIALGELVSVQQGHLLRREITLGLMHGVLLGILVGAVGLLWTGNVGVALVLAVAMLGNMVVAGATGAGVPLFLRRMGIDPAIASAVIVTTFTDVLGFLVYLGAASLALSLIV